MEKGLVNLVVFHMSLDLEVQLVDLNTGDLQGP